MAQPVSVVKAGLAGPPALTAGVAGHLKALSVEHLVAMSGTRPLVEVCWAAAAPDDEVVDEATAQAATGVMHVHGRSGGTPRGLAADYLSTACTVLAVQGLLAAALGRVRGAAIESVRTGVDLAGLLAVGQYLAAASAEESEAVPLVPGGPPFVTAEGVWFEIETLDPAVWVGFWQRLGVPGRLAGSAWRSFQFRYATACSPLPAELHAATCAADWTIVQKAGEEAGASVCALHPLAHQAVEAPWTLSPRSAARPLPAAAEGAPPLAGLTVLEAGRRIQAPLTAYLLSLLGADVVRIEPPGGDPLRGMPPTSGGLSARWLALNRGKRAVEIDIKSRAGRDELLGMVADADVFVHNWAPGTADRLGLDDGVLRTANPGLVYAHTSGWAGRLENAPLGTDFMVQARTGVGEAVRPDGETPAPSLMTLLDVLGGLLGTEAVLAGLLTRACEGRGARVESSLLGAAEQLTGPAVRRIAAGQPARRPPGFRCPVRTADGWVVLADGDAAGQHAGSVRGSSTAEAVRLLRARGLRATAVTTSMSELPADPRFASVLTRDDHGAVAAPAPWRFT